MPLVKLLFIQYLRALLTVLTLVTISCSDSEPVSITEADLVGEWRLEDSAYPILIEVGPDLSYTITEEKSNVSNLQQFAKMNGMIMLLATSDTGKIQHSSGDSFEFLANSKESIMHILATVVQVNEEGLVIILGDKKNAPIQMKRVGEQAFSDDSSSVP